MMNISAEQVEAWKALTAEERMRMRLETAAAIVDALGVELTDPRARNEVDVKMVLKFTVPFDTDPNKVQKIFKRVGRDLMEDPLYKDSLIKPFVSNGVFDFDDVGMIVVGEFRSKQGAQSTIKKEICTRIIKAFHENGIDFARRDARSLAKFKRRRSERS